MKKTKLTKKDGTVIGDYIMVHERVMHFSSEEKYKGWQLITELIETPDPDVARIKATVINELGQVYRTAHAQERHGDGFINQTSHLENAETSAIGRVLGFCNIGIDTGIASYEEVANAVKQQDGKPWMSHKDFSTLVRSLNEEPSDSRRAILYKAADGQFRMKKDYRKQLLEIVEQRDINV